MRQLLSRTSQVLVDLAVLLAAYFLAAFLRFEGWPNLWMVKRLLLNWPYVVALQYAMLLAMGVPRSAWSYVGLREARRIVTGLAASAAVLFVLRAVSTALEPRLYFFQYLYNPAGVILIDLALAVLGVVGVRVLRRMAAERQPEARLSLRIVERPTLLVGAGQAGVTVAREIAQHPELGIRAVGFLDDDPAKIGTEIQGIPVLGPTAKAAELARRVGAEDVIITIAHASGKDIRRIQQLCEGLTVKIVPGVFDILGGKVKLSHIREVSIDDLLGRQVVQLDTDLIERFIRGKRVLITGAGGSIGSELCRQVAKFSPASLVLVERAEYHLFLIHEELSTNEPGLSTVPCICDINDPERVEAVFARHRPHVVFHAAAHKHVPMMEWNPGEAVKNNVCGTVEIANAADRHGAESFVMISTDKAVNPSSIMGATKRVAEMYVQAMSQRSKTKYVAVRFGNVLGSTGSVIPTFKAQIAKGGPIRVTHPEMKRYFMTIPEASQLVTQAAAMGRGGEIFVLDMGEPVRIVDLAKDLVRLSGLTVDEDIKIEFVGLRPGEKLFEELGFDAEKMRRTGHQKIFEGTMAPCSWETVTQHLARLGSVTGAASATDVRRLLHLAVPEMLPDAPASAPAPGPAASPGHAGGDSPAPGVASAALNAMS
jgi:FlaA1/EpsC-like NDP-sugar epimerase